jgi:UDPglucose--hexose-1-phosphate uridylyltransferase
MLPEMLREIRINPIIPAESVLIATERGNRPVKKIDSSFLDLREKVSNCQFCPGNEHLTPSEILHIPPGANWQIRVVRNLYPVFGDDRSLPDLNLGIHHVIDGYGQHEVIIDHSHHGIQMSEMDLSHIASLFQVYRDRMKRLYNANESHRYVLVFKNFGPASGGSIAHTHSQIIAMPVIPANVEMEISSSLKHYRLHGSCIFCTLMDENLNYETIVYDRLAGQLKRRIEVGRYIVERGDSFVAIKPFASRHPWEIHILPRIHCHDYRNISDTECLDLAGVLRRVLLRLQAVLGPVQYNYFLHSAPEKLATNECHESFHWHLEICPRTTIPNGFELGSGLTINTVNPETAADELNKIRL